MGVLSFNKEIGPDTILQRKTDILFNQIDGEVVILSVENSEYYGMDKVASRIWNLLERKISLKELISILLDEFKISHEQCMSDTLEFIYKLKEKKLIIAE